MKLTFSILTFVAALFLGCPGQFLWQQSSECQRTQCREELGSCHGPVAAKLLHLRTSTTRETAIEVAVRQSGVLHTRSTEVPTCALAATCAAPNSSCDLLLDGMSAPFEVSLICEQGRVREAQSTKLPYGTDGSTWIGRAVVDDESNVDQVAFTAFDEQAPINIVIRTLDTDGARAADEEFNIEADGSLSLGAMKHFFDFDRPIRQEYWLPCDDDVTSCLSGQRFYLWDDNGKVLRISLDEDADGTVETIWDLEYEDGAVSRVLVQDQAGGVEPVRIVSCCSHFEACAAYRELDEGTFSPVE